MSCSVKMEEVGAIGKVRVAKRKDVFEVEMCDVRCYSTPVLVKCGRVRFTMKKCDMGEV